MIFHHKTGLVFVLNAILCYQGSELEIELRNILSNQTSDHKKTQL